MVQEIGFTELPITLKQMRRCFKKEMKRMLNEV